MYDLIVVGGGPAGLFGAINAAAAGRRVLLIENLNSCGRKLLATGGGRCNLTNILPPREMSRRFGETERFVRHALFAFSSADLVGWFEERGVAMELTDNFHYFPASGRADDCLQLLLRCARAAGVEFRNGVCAEKILIADHTVRGVITSAGEFAAPRLLIASGGNGYPALGARGAGFRLAAGACHTVTPLSPGMVGLRTAEQWVRECAGIALPDVSCRIALPGEEKHCCRGELLFTQSGISAFAVLDLSGRVGSLLAGAKNVPLRLNLFASTPSEEWTARFRRWRQESGTRKTGKLLSEYMPQKLANFLSGALSDTVPSRLTQQEQKYLLAQLSDLELNIVGTDGWEKAMVTVGGVALDEVDPRTMASKIVNGLCFAGEVLNVNGPCGGYNLQWAFSSARLSGQA